MIKKIAIALLLVSGGAVVAETAQAPTLQMNGYAAMVGAGAFQSNNSNGQGGAQHIGISASNIYFTAKGVSTSGFQYKWRVAMESYPGGKSTLGSAIYFTQNYIEFGLVDLGIFQIGNLTGVEDTMTESGFNLMGGAASIDGTFTNITNTAEGVIGGAQMANQTSKSTKIVYYTPSVGGLTFGVAYTPNTTRMGTGGRDNAGGPGDNTHGNEGGIYPSKSGSAYGMHNVAAGVKYVSDFKSWNMALAAIVIAENSKRGRKGYFEDDSLALDFYKYKSANNSRSAHFTAAVGIDQWRFATGLILNGKSRLPKADGYSTGDAGRAWNFGAQYTVGAYQFALGYFKTMRELPRIPAGQGTNGVRYASVGGKAESDIVSATIDFNALQGLKFFGEVDFFNSRTNKEYAKFIGQTRKYTDKGGKTAITDNAGTAVIVGTKLSF